MTLESFMRVVPIVLDVSIDQLIQKNLLKPPMTERLANRSQFNAHVVCASKSLFLLANGEGFAG